MTDDTTAQDLLRLMQDRAFVRAAPGEQIPLASGKRTTFYFDGKRVTMTPEAMPIVGQLVWEESMRRNVHAVGGLAAGSIPISDAAVAYDAYIGKRGLRGFYVRDEPKAHGTKEVLYAGFTSDGRELVRTGARVLIVDDVMTTGSSLLKAIDEVESRGAEVAGVLVLIDRLDPRAEAGIKSRFDVVSILESDDNGNLTISRGLSGVGAR